jgi:hypothetical protein
MKSAGSLAESKRNDTVGTTCWLFSHELDLIKLPPKLRLCVPVCQVNVSSMLVAGAARQLGVVVVNHYVARVDRSSA